jgi:hypothetical protein
MQRVKLFEGSPVLGSWNGKTYIVSAGHYHGEFDIDLAIKVIRDRGITLAPVRAVLCSCGSCSAMKGDITVYARESRIYTFVISGATPEEVQNLLTS